MIAQRVTECELLVMKGIWSKNYDMALPEIMNTVNEAYGKQWAPQTVSTFLKRLVNRGYLSMTRKGRSFYYHELISEEEYASAEIVDYCRFWCQNDASKILENLINVRELTPDEKKKIRKIVK